MVSHSNYDPYQNKCSKCGSASNRVYSHYQTKSNGKRLLYQCRDCGAFYSETTQTFLFNLKTPLSKIAMVLNSRTEGMSFNATCRVHHISPHTLRSWEQKFADLKKTLSLYSISQSFLSLIVEGDELYTRVNSNKPQELSEGWTILLLERSSRFIFELNCGEKDRSLFLKAIEAFVELIKGSDNVALLTDGERRYSAILFEICHELLKTGKPGRPKKVLPEGVQVKLKNKGNQSHKRGPKREKYQTPKSEHPGTTNRIDEKAIHANHTEAQNASFRRKLSPYRRRTNTYAKTKQGLQRVLDAYWCIHNFVREHFTLKTTPAVKLGIIEKPMTWKSIMSVKMIF